MLNYVGGHAVALTLAVVLTMTSAAFSATNYYVDENGDNRNSGTSADDAWQTITYALDYTTGTGSNPVIIHVAAGTYDVDLGESFPLEPNDYDTITGAGTESTVVYGDDAHSVFRFASLGTQVKIESLSITHGQNNNGGGIYCDSASPTIEDCAIAENEAVFGGGVWITDECSPTILNCTIKDNKAENGGAGLCICEGASPNITGSSVSNNSLDDSDDGWAGAGVYIRLDSSPELVDCTIKGNTGAVRGGGLFIYENCSPAIRGTTVRGNSALKKENGCGGGIAIGDSCSPTVEDCSIENNESYSGGGVAVFGDSSPTLENCSIENNEAITQGGGIRTYNHSSPYIDSCVIANNEAGQSGGGLDIYSYSSPTVINCTISGNALTDPISYWTVFGAGIHIRDNCSPLITNCTIEHNTGSSWGGGIAIHYDSSPTVTGTRIAYNEANKRDDSVGSEGMNGGGIYTSVGGAPLIEGCIIESNETKKGGGIIVGNYATIRNCTISGNRASSRGGGIHGGASGAPAIENCAIEGNEAIYGGGYYVYKKCVPSMKGCTLSGNTATLDGGGVMFDGQYDAVGPDVVIEDCIIFENIAGEHGSGVCCSDDASPTIENCTITHNDGKCGGGLACLNGSSPALTNCTIDDNYAPTHGGGAYCYGENTSPYFKSCTINSNEAEYCAGGILCQMNASVEMVGCEVSYNTLGGGGSTHGGAGIRVCDEASAEITDCEIIGNTGALSGGGISGTSGGGIGSVTVRDTRIDSNRCDFDGSGVRRGGGVYCSSDCELIMEDCSVVKNWTGDIAGGIHLANPATIKNCTITANTVLDDGAGVYIKSCSPTIEDCIIFENIAGRYGGGVCCIDDSEPTIENCTITYNDGKYGGGLACLNGSSPTLTNCTIDDNYAPTHGGGAYCYGEGTSLYIESCTINSNEAENCAGGILGQMNASVEITGCEISYNTLGGGGSTHGGAGIRVCDEASVEITDCEIIGNTGALSGGGISGTSGGGIGSITIRGTQVDSNMCDFDGDGVKRGGGVYCSSDCELIMENCSVENNWAGDIAGGIHMLQNPATIKNCSVVGNTVSDLGGGIYIKDCSPVIENCSIEGNEARRGAGIYCNTCSPSLEGCAIDENSASEQGGGVYAEDDAQLLLVSSSISYNSVVDDSDYPAGGGICAHSSHLSIQDCSIDGNTGVTAGGGLALFTSSSLAAFRTSISSNTTNREAQGAYLMKGGGIYALSDCELLFEDCTLEGNESRQGGAASFACPATFSGCVMRGNQVTVRGGAIYCSGGTQTFDGCILDGNMAGELGGGICCQSDSSPTLLNNLVISNAAIEGAGIWCSDGSSPEIASCTIADNAGHGAYADGGSEPTLTNCLLWGNDDDLVNIGCTQISHCDIEDEDCEGENGNFSENPLFVAGYYLSQTASGQASDSPCLDAGDDAASAYGLDEYTTRTDGEFDVGVVDVGYHYSEGTDWEDENHPPALSSGQVDPRNGTTQTRFTYSVHYYDEDGDAPLIHSVYIDGDLGHEMSLQSGNPSNGTYAFETALDGGEHLFYFYFEDGDGAWDRAPENGSYDGPSVHPTPILIDGDVDPDCGTSGTIFTYSVRYLGNDDNAPWVRKVYIDDVGHDMTFTIGEPSNGTYILETSLPIGVHNFYFYFENASGQSARDPQTGVYIGPTVLTDFERPSSCCTGPETANESPITIDYTSSDDLSGVAFVELYMRHNGSGYTMTDSSTEPNGSFNVELSHGDGTYDFYTVAEDRVGYREAPPVTPDVTVQADITMPASVCRAPEYTSVLPFAVVFDASDPGSGLKETRLWYRYVGEATWINSWLTQPGESGTFSFDPTVITPEYGDGIYELMTIASDNAGNIEAPPASPDASTVVDRTAPTSLVTCEQRSRTSPISIPFAALDGLSGITTVALWYRHDGGEWQASGLSASGESGTFEFAFPHGDGVYDFGTCASDLAGNTEQLTASGAFCVFDTSPPVSSAQAEGVVNQPSVNIMYQAVDELTDVQSVHLYYRYSDFEGNVDDTLVDTGLEETSASGTFECQLQNIPGRYNLYVCAIDGVDNVEDADGEPDTVCLYDPTLALSSMEAPLYTTEATISITFTTSVADDGYDQVRLYYRHGTTEAEATAANWVSTSTVSPELSGTLEFIRQQGDGHYQFFTRARSASGTLEPIPDLPDATTIVDAAPPETSLVVPAMSAAAEFGITFSTIEAYGLDAIDFYCWHKSAWTHFCTVHEMNGCLDFNTLAQEGEFRFYSVGRDMAGNVEKKDPEEHHFSTLVDLSPPASHARAESYGTAFPIEVSYTAMDTVTEVVSVALWARFESSEWLDTGLMNTSSSGVFNYAPTAGETKEGTYYFYTVAVDEMGHVEKAPPSPDAQAIIDWTAPVTSCSAPPYSSDGIIRLTYSADDAVSGLSSVAVWVKPHDEEWVDTGLSCSSNESTVEIDVSASGEGAFGFCVLGLDNAGNLENLPETAPATTIFDASAPESQAIFPADGVCTNEAPINVPFSASDGASGVASVELWFKFNGSNWESSGLSSSQSDLSLFGDANFAFTPSHGDGIYEFASVAADNAGNRELLPESPDGGKLIFDQTAPTSMVTFDGQYASEFPIALSFQAQDETSGIASIALFVSINGSDYRDTGLTASGQSGVIEYSPSTIIDGEYCFIGVATDQCGNIEASASQADATVVFDSTAPISSANVSSQYTNRLPLSVSFAASDPTSGVAEVHLWASFNGGAFFDSGLVIRRAEGTFAFVPKSFEDGCYSFFTIAADNAGAIEAAKDRGDASVIVDTERPISSCSTAKTMTSSFPIALDYTSSDELSGVECVEIFYRIDRGAWTLAQTLTEPTGTFAFTPNANDDGYYEFYSAAFDRATNTEIMDGVDDAITVDTTEPESSASSPASAESLPISVSFIASDDGAGVETTTLWFKHNNGAWENSELSRSGTIGSFEFDAPAGPGMYSFYTISTDYVGNIETAPVSSDAKCVYAIAAPDIHLSAELVDFGDVEIGEQRSRTLTVSNVGGADLTIADVSVTDPLGGDSAFVSEIEADLPVILGPGESLETAVTFLPDSEGAFGAELAFASDDPDTPYLYADLLGNGTAGQLTLDVWTNADHYSFGDTLTVGIGCHNTAIARTVDIYLMLTFDPSGVEERTWFAVLSGEWVESAAPLTPSLEMSAGLELTTEWWTTELPCSAPLISRTGTYMLQTAAVDTGTLDLVSNLAITDFILTGEPFVDVSTDKATYSLDGDMVVVSLDVDVPYDLTADVYVLMLTPGGQFWSPTGFGEATWAASTVPIISSITLDEGFTFSGPAFTTSLPADAPFDAAGQFMLFAALVEPGTLSPLSDIGTASFALQ